MKWSFFLIIQLVYLKKATKYNYNDNYNDYVNYIRVHTSG